MGTRSTPICSFSALFRASSSSNCSFRPSLSSESSVPGSIPNLNQPRVMHSMPKTRVKPTQRGEQLRSVSYKYFLQNVVHNALNNSLNDGFDLAGQIRYLRQ